MHKYPKVDWLPEPKLPLEHRIDEHVHGLIDATNRGDTREVQSHQEWLMQTAANAVVAQDADSTEALRAYLAPLAIWATKKHWGEPGDRWRAVGDLLQLVVEIQLPLSQIRSASGEIPREVLRQVAEHPGIRPTVVAENLGKLGKSITANNLSNHLGRLEREGLIHRMRYGQSIRLYLARGEHDLLTRLQPLAELLGVIYRANPEPIQPDVPARRDGGKRETVQPPDMRHAAPGGAPAGERLGRMTAPGARSNVIVLKDILAGNKKVASR